MKKYICKDLEQFPKGEMQTEILKPDFTMNLTSNVGLVWILDLDVKTFALLSFVFL